tara:strand:+ start:307 stop:495 length:189 start_codon:yes stop_codon:yes gene_type:complete
MEKWQFIFVSFAIGGFFFQIILITGVYFISNYLPKEKTEREILESIYNQPSFAGYLQRNLKI